MEMERRIGKDVENGGSGDHEKTGTVWSASAHIVAAVVGSGVLALAWTVAQLGWVIGPIVLFGFSCVTYYTSAMLADCYRYPDPITGTINHEYIDAVRCYLGRKSEILCGCAQYVNLWGTLVGYTITASTSMIAVKRANCFHRYGHDANCTSSGSTFMIIFGLFQLVLSQLPSLENITWLSIVAVATSFGYSFISLGLCAGKLVSHGEFRGTLTGTSSANPGVKGFNVLLALGNMAFAYTFADVLIEIQFASIRKELTKYAQKTGKVESKFELYWYNNSQTGIGSLSTLKAPAENKKMKKATFYGLGLTTVFYLLLGCIGYAAFGNDAPGNILTGFGFYEPFWLVDMANVCVIVHLIGAYQVYAQPIFARLESFIACQWPEAKFLHKTYYIASVNVSILSLVLRTILIMFTTLVAMLVPFFNAVLGLIGAVGFWPLSVYFPVSMHISQRKIRRWEPKWFWLQGLSLICLLISLAASIGSVQDIVHNLKTAALFKTVY